MTLDINLARRLVRAALDEDRADDDVTTRALVPLEQKGRAELIAKASGVLAGLALAREVFLAVDPGLVWAEEREDGAQVAPGDRIATVEGSLASILRGERVALNFLTHLSGVATAANEIVRMLDGTGCRLRDTRKTIPGLRALEKYATRMGGAVNHRFDLSDGVLVKDNHLAAVYARDLAIGDAVRMARAGASGMRVEIEVTTLEEARQAADAGAEELLLDNMSPAQVREVVAALEAGEKRPVLEASGGITAQNAREYAEAGVDHVSMGAITHSAGALDMSLEVELA
jgi:nicotinate-nucleotide pyrophosphorylase (carboxylating)